MKHFSPNRLFPLLFISGFVFSLSTPVGAKSTQICRNDIATTTTYYVPEVKDLCGSSKPCPEFKKAVKLQGSGKLNDKTILTASGDKIDTGDCKTAFGASGNCLIPYISVAADPHYHHMGDIIDMPGLRGTTIILPDGKKMIHPGYFIVEDTGGGIKGPNRFDIFTGSHDGAEAAQALVKHTGDEPELTSKSDCGSEKQFTTLKAEKPKDEAAYNEAKTAIANAIDPDRAPAKGQTAVAAKESLNSPYVGGTR